MDRKKDPRDTEKGSTRHRKSLHMSHLNPMNYKDFLFDKRNVKEEHKQTLSRLIEDLSTERHQDPLQRELTPHTIQ